MRLRRRVSYLLAPLQGLAMWLLLSQAALAQNDAPVAEAPAEKPATAEPAEKAAPEAKKDEEGIAKRWVRVQRDDKGTPISLETSVVRYTNEDKSITVDLIGAIHVGDDDYYREFNKRFAGYDSLLFELVAPEGTVVEKGRGTSNRHPVGALQNGMKNLLALEHQLEKVDYSKKNFVHADMTPEEFSKKMEERGESFLQMFFQMMGQSMAAQAQQSEGASDADLLLALFDKDRPTKLKRIMAAQFEGMESMFTTFGGPDGTTIITERNKKALTVLKRELDAGKKNIGIFYGAGHMADMSERLINEFHLKPVSEEWIIAWNLGAKK